MQSAFGTLSDAMRSPQVLDGSTMVGRDILVASEDATLQAEGAVKGAFDVPTGTTSLTLDIRDANGTLVRHSSVAACQRLAGILVGRHCRQRHACACGHLHVRLAVAGGGGRSESLEMLLASRVTSVTIDSGTGLTLNTRDLGSRAPSDVRRVM